MKLAWAMRPNNSGDYAKGPQSEISKNQKSEFQNAGRPASPVSRASQGRVMVVALFSRQ
jgi:hypothetical protein